MSEERGLDLNEEGDIIMYEIRYKHWMDVAKEGNYKKKMHALRSEIYVKDKEELIKIYFWCSFQIRKGGALFGIV